jgi:FkbM family methyltransferase
MNQINIKTKYLVRDLNRDSVVLDVGGFRGEWAFHIADRYGCAVHVFEPFKKNYKYINKHRREHNKIILHKKVVSDIDGKIKFYITENLDGCSIFDRSKLKIMKKIVKKANVFSVTLLSFMMEESIAMVDLLKMNCEGAEIPILKSISKDLAPRIRQITFSGHAPKITTLEAQEEALDHIKSVGYVVEPYSNEQVSGRFYCCYEGQK